MDSAPWRSEPVDEFSPAWSPDGKHLAFQRQVDESEWVEWPTLHVSNVGRGCRRREQQRLEPIEGDVIPALWSPDGTRLLSLVFVANPNAVHLGVVSVDGSSPMVDPAGFRVCVLAAGCRAAAARAVVPGAD